MIAFAVAGQALDLATYLAGVSEHNPTVLALGVFAVPAKLLLVGFLVLLGVKLGSDWRVKVALALGCAAGVVGAAANVGVLRP